MSVQSDSDSGPDDTTISVRRDVQKRLQALKPYQSVSYNDLIVDMIEVYTEEKDL